MKPVLAQLVRIERDHDGALIPSERRRGRDSRKRGKHRAHPIQCEILNFGLRAIRANKGELTYRNAAGIKARDERRDCSRGHKGPGPVYVADGLRHGIGHVGVRLKHQLHQRGALDISALDVLNADDVEEVIFEVVVEKSFHLAGIHSAIGLCDVDSSVADDWKDVDAHAVDG